MLHQPYSLEDGYQIVLDLGSALQQDILERFRSDLVNYLRKQLQNDQLNLISRLVQEEVKGKIYTSQDKYQYLVRKNPQLQELRKRLGLDIDF
ncbi:MAG: hypothetical protein ACNS62_03980 [Candidatus Cyclobacteriaceae bacterium M3_2C_046]